MSLEKPYLDVPGTTIFDAEQSRRGYWLNQFCMSLMKADNRARFKADERAYLDEWAMTEEQKQAVLARDLNRCIALGGNIYFLAKIGATDGLSFQQMAGSMTGMSEDEYRAMMVAGGRSVEGNRHVGEDGDAQAHRQPQGRRPDEKRRRPESRRPERTGLTWPGYPRPSILRMSPPLARRSILARPASPIGSRCSRAMNSPSNG